MSFNRYIFICHHKYYDKIFKKPTCVAMCILLYLTGLTLVLLNLAGIGDHSFDRKSLECIWDRMATYYYTVAFSVLLVWIPVTITGIFYLKIYISVRTSTKKITEVTCSNHNRKAIKLARTLFFIYMIFSSCWIPYALIIVVDRNDTFPYESHLILTAFGHLHPSINWLIYYFTNTKFRKAFDELVKLNKLFDLCKAKKKVEAMEMTKTTTNSNDLLVTKTQHILSSSTTEWNFKKKVSFTEVGSLFKHTQLFISWHKKRKDLQIKMKSISWIFQRFYFLQVHRQKDWRCRSFEERKSFLMCNFIHLQIFSWNIQVIYIVIKQWNEWEPWYTEIKLFPYKSSETRRSSNKVSLLTHITFSLKKKRKQRRYLSFEKINWW